MPTRSGVATTITAVLALAAGRVFGIYELYIVAAAMIALVGCAWLWVILNWRSLQVTRAVNPQRLHAGTSSTVTLNLSNQRSIPTPVARITDEVQGAVRADAQVPPIRRHSSTRASYRVPTETRGRVEIGPMSTRVTDPFGLASSFRTSAPDTSLLVLPRIDVIAPPPQPGGDVTMQIDRSPNRVGANGDDFSSLRAYEIGDDLRKVHWPSSARTGELVVRNEHIPEHGHSLVLLDVRSSAADPETFENMVSAAASLIVACRERGDRVRLVTTAGVDHSANTPKACDALLDMLAVVEQVPNSHVQLPFRPGRGGAETGAMVVANDAEELIASMPLSGSGSQNTYIVRFHPEGARPQQGSSRLTSGRMVDIERGEEFAATWARVVRR